MTPKIFKHLLNRFTQKENELIKGIEQEISNKAILSFLLLYTELGSSIIATIFFVALGFFDFKGALLIGLIYFFQVGCVELLKLAFKRKRPAKHTPDSKLGVRLTSGSFPSGHTSNVFAIAFLLSNYYSVNLPLTSAFFGIAGLVALSRIVLAKHFIGDVAGGAFFGIVFAILGSFIATVIAPVLPF